MSWDRGVVTRRLERKRARAQKGSGRRTHTACTASGIVAVLCVHASSGQGRYAAAGLDNPTTGRLNQVLLVLTVTPAAPWLVATVLGTIATVAAVTYLPAWLGTQQPVGHTLAAEIK